VNVTEGLHDLVADEPPFVLRPDEVLAAGRRRRRRGGIAVAGSGAVAASVVVGSVLLVHAPSSGSASVRFGGQPTAAAASDSGDLTSPYYQLARAHTPAGWVISRAHSEDGSGWWADVDDGNGAGRLGMFRSTASLQQHPCSDSEFVAKAASCTETMLDADTRLIVRSVSHTDPVNDIQVVIVHGDGSGVNVSDDNATWPDIPPGTSFTTPAQKRYFSHGTVGSAIPLYSTDQLVEIAKALDEVS
jgi:hypothetical protein